MNGRASLTPRNTGDQVRRGDEEYWKVRSLRNMGVWVRGRILVKFPLEIRGLG